MKILFLFFVIVSPVFSEGQIESIFFGEYHEDGERYILNKYEYDSLVAVFGEGVANYVSNNTFYSTSLESNVTGRYLNGKISVNPILAKKFRDTYVIVHEAYHYFSRTRGIALDTSHKTYKVDCLELSGGKLCSEQEAEIARAIGILLVGHKTVYNIENGIENFNFDLVYLRGSLYMYADEYMGIHIPQALQDAILNE